MDKQSVRISVDRLYYALVTADTSLTLTHGTPVRLGGVAEIVVTKNSSKKPHFSDGGVSELISQDGVTQVKVKLDGVSSEIKAAILGTSYVSASGLYKEGMGEAPVYLALGYRAKKSNGYYKYTWFYKGSFAKADATDATITETVSEQAEEYVYTAIKPVYFEGQTYGLKQSYHSDDSNAPSGLTDALLAVPETGWFSSPQYVPIAPGTAITDLAGATGSGASGTMALTFTAPAGCTSAYVQVKDPISGVWQTATTSAAIVAASTSATVTGLTPGNTYDVRLVVIGGTKNGFSNTDEDVVAHS